MLEALLIVIAVPFALVAIAWLGAVVFWLCAYPAVKLAGAAYQAFDVLIAQPWRAIRRRFSSLANP